MGILLARPPRRRSSVFRPTGRQPHPDDVLKRLARDGRATLGPTIYVGRKRPFDAVRAMALTMLGLLLLVGGVAALPFVLPHNTIKVTGLRASKVFFSPAGLRSAEVFFQVSPASALKNLHVRIDGEPATVVVEGARLRWVPNALAEGEHKLTLRSGSRFLWRGPASKTFRVVIDSVQPTLTLDDVAQPGSVDQPVTIRGTVEDGATVKVAGRTVPVTKGQFSRRFSVAPIGIVRVEATDAAGNVTAIERRAPAVLPSLQGVHVSAEAWADPALKAGVLNLARTNRINTIVLDLKDESGRVGYRSSSTKVNDIGAGAGLYDLRAAVTEIHAMGLRVGGRIVAFRDPLLTRASVNAGRLDEVVQTPTGETYESTYGTFANPVSPAVQSYLLDIVREASAAGVDDLFYDYIRRPEGAMSTMVFAGLTDPSAKGIEDAIVTFVAKTARTLRGTRTRLGVSVFGISAKLPHDVGQDVPALARVVDYVAPMVYPSHWRSGFYNVVDPPNSPYEIVSRSVEDFRDRIADSGAALVPWLQDFSLAPARTYGAQEVRLQIQAAREQQVGGFLLWDPKVTYTTAGIPTDAPGVDVPAVQVGSPAPGAAPTVPATTVPATTAAAGVGASAG